MRFAAASAWAWMLQRLTAIILIVLLAGHFWINHFADPSAGITFMGVTAKLKNVLLVFVDAGLLVGALYHGLNGLRNILLDYGVSPASARAATAVLFLIGAAWLVYGVWVLRAFLVA